MHTQNTRLAAVAASTAALKTTEFTAHRASTGTGREMSVRANNKFYNVKNEFVVKLERV